MIYVTSKTIFFSKKECKNLCIFLHYMGVKKNSYAGFIAIRLYNEFFGERYNLKKYYNQYYKKEFESCESFLINCWNINEKLAKKVSQGKYFFTFRKYKMDTPSYYLGIDESLKKLFNNFVGGIKYEN